MKNTKGFTIVELVVVMAILSILFAVLLPSFDKMLRDVNISSNDKIINSINSTLKTDFNNKNGLTLDTTNLNNNSKAYSQEFIEKYDLPTDFEVVFYGGDTTNVDVIKDVKNDSSNTLASYSSAIAIILPSKEATTTYKSSFTLNMNKPLFIIHKSEYGTKIYENGLDVTSSYN